MEIVFPVSSEASDEGLEEPPSHSQRDRRSCFIFRSKISWIIYLSYKDLGSNETLIQ